MILKFLFKDFKFSFRDLKTLFKDFKIYFMILEFSFMNLKFLFKDFKTLFKDFKIYFMILEFSFMNLKFLFKDFKTLFKDLNQMLAVVLETTGDISMLVAGSEGEQLDPELLKFVSRTSRMNNRSQKKNRSSPLQKLPRLYSQDSFKNPLSF